METVREISPELWQARATMWELLALSFRYPDAVLAEIVASGEWAEAARELAAALGVGLPDGFAEGLVEYEAADLALGEPGAIALESVDSVGTTPGAVSSAGFEREVSDSDARLHSLRAEATRLFVGAPEPAVSPYEGVWRAQADGVQALLFVNPHSMEVERFMKACGLGRPEGTNEPLDHVATECELLQYLASLAAGIVELPETAPAPVSFPEGSPAAAYEAFLKDHARTWMPDFVKATADEARQPFYRVASGLLEVVATG